MTVSRSSSGSIVVGDLITSLVVSLGLEHELHPYSAFLGYFALDIAACRSQYIVRAKRPGRYTLMIAHRDNKDEGVNQLLPEDGAYIDMELIRDDPPPDDPPPPSNHSPHIPVSPTHTTHFSADHFAGTSFGHQSREEYHYVGILTSLDGVLCSCVSVTMHMWNVTNNLGICSEKFFQEYREVVDVHPASDEDGRFKGFGHVEFAIA
ncbi:hypothetical protein KIW84_033613 [Lathyrus oleraceus]|uniref:Uncharacterized protein n=1 Tax=Pisum sativum TaxID=3888 RepID=A0A9D5B049_PEA|nr:hypothetical protein KIW84_033613 [Pisum sativum]